MIDYSYTELDDDVSRIFNHTDAENYKTAVLENTLLYAECEDEPDMFLFHLALIVYEVKHNILTDRMKADFIQCMQSVGIRGNFSLSFYRAIFLLFRKILIMSAQF